MFQQYREFPFEIEMKEMEMRLKARGFKKVINNHANLSSKEYKIIYHFGTYRSNPQPLRYGIEWMEG